jgi:biotin operon repressor
MTGAISFWQQADAEPDLYATSQAFTWFARKGTIFGIAYLGFETETVRGLRRTIIYGQLLWQEKHSDEKPRTAKEPFGPFVDETAARAALVGEVRRLWGLDADVREETEREKRAVPSCWRRGDGVAKTGNGRKPFDRLRAAQGAGGDKMGGRGEMQAAFVEKLKEALAGHTSMETGVKGDELAGKLGMRRQEVVRRIMAARKGGLAVGSKKNFGYWLEAGGEGKSNPTPPAQHTTSPHSTSSGQAAGEGKARTSGEKMIPMGQPFSVGFSDPRPDPFQRPPVAGELKRRTFVYVVAPGISIERDVPQAFALEIARKVIDAGIVAAAD